MNPLAEVRTPELAATAGGRPCFWKNRMTSVALPAVPPTSPVNALANWTPMTGPNGRRAEHRAEHRHGLGELGQLGDHEREQDPSPDRPGEDVAHGGDAGELGDQEVDTEGERRGQQDHAEGEAVQLGGLGRLDARQRRAGVAEAGQECLGFRHVALGGTGQRRRLQEGEQLDEIVGAERRDGRPPAPGPRPRARRWWRGAAPGRAGGGRRWRTVTASPRPTSPVVPESSSTTLPTHGLPWAMRPPCRRPRFAQASSSDGIREALRLHVERASPPPGSARPGGRRRATPPGRRRPGRAPGRPCARRAAPRTPRARPGARG